MASAASTQARTELTSRPVFAASVPIKYVKYQLDAIIPFFVVRKNEINSISMSNFIFNILCVIFKLECGFKRAVILVNTASNLVNVQIPDRRSIDAHYFIRLLQLHPRSRTEFNVVDHW